MFQNLEQEDISKQEEKKSKEKKTSILSKVFEFKNIILYIISFMVSTISLGQAVSPFSLAIVGASLSCGIPAMGIIILGFIGNIIGLGSNGALNYILTILFVMMSFLLKPPRYNEEYKNEKIKLSRKLFISTLLIGIIKSMASGLTIYNILANILLSILVVIFYKIFVNSMQVLQNVNEKKAFSLEEVMGASLLLAISATAIGEFSIFGFGVRNILCILIVLTLGWKNGALVGATAGITIGVTLGIISELEPIIIAAFAISGMLAGLLNRLGRIGVIAGFVIGNIILAYIAKIGTEHLILIREILIASVGLLAIPKNININIEELNKKESLLPVWNSRTLNKSKEAIEKLNSVSDVIQDMASTYAEVAATTIDEQDIIEKNKQIFMSNLLDNLVGLENNMLYEDISKTESKIVNELFNIVLQKQEIDRADLLKTFAKYNNYIIGFDDENVSKYLEKNIMQIVNCINNTYKISKADFIFEEKIKENKKNLQTQLDGVSKAIANIAEGLKENIKEDIKREQEFFKQKQEITLLLEQKEIYVTDLSINKKQNDRFFVTIYFRDIIGEKELVYVEKILGNVLKEQIVLNTYGIAKGDSIEKILDKDNKLDFLSKDKFTLRNKHFQYNES